MQEVYVQLSRDYYDYFYYSAIISGTDENMAKKDELWAYMKEHDEETYKKLRHGVMGQLMNLPGKGGRKVAIGAYKLSQKVVGFN